MQQAAHTDQLGEITELLEESTEPQLIDSLFLVPTQYITALNDMIAHERSNRTFKSVTRFHVVQDVIALVEGHPESAHFSKPFLKTV